MEVVTAQNFALIDELVLEDSRLKVKEISLVSSVSETRIRRILHHHLGMNKISTRWVRIYLSVPQR